MTRQDLIRQLLDFDRGKVRRGECIVTWKALADELDVSEDTLQRWCAAEGIELPRWGRPSARPRVYLPRPKLLILRALFLG